MFDLEKFKSGEYFINTPTQEIYDDVLQFLEDNNIRWVSGSEATTNDYWWVHGENTCLVHSDIDEGIYYSNRPIDLQELVMSEPSKIYVILDPRFGFLDDECEISSNAFDLAHAAGFSEEDMSEVVEECEYYIPIKITRETYKHFPFDIEMYAPREEVIATQITGDTLVKIITKLASENAKVQWLEGEELTDADMLQEAINFVEDFKFSVLIYDNGKIHINGFEDSNTIREIYTNLLNNDVSQLVSPRKFVEFILK